VQISSSGDFVSLGPKICDMIRKCYLFLFLMAFMPIACTGPEQITSSATGKNEILGVQALLWYQQAAETEALYLQGYNVAAERVRDYAHADGDLPLAVVLDIDETVLDNSPFNVELLRKGNSYSEEKWAAWCERREALPLPGALEFTKLSDSLGIALFYVSNRAAGLMDATLDNLQKYGFPNADEEHVMLKTTTSSKDTRRAAIRQNFEIALLLGDNLGDFDGIFEDRTEHYGKPAVQKRKEQFGRKFIVFPNPIYGSWVRGAFPEGMPVESEVLDQLRGYGQ
jgi:5'-nucleotidase (lipoprotein e(P4) family)